MCVNYWSYHELDSNKSIHIALVSIIARSKLLVNPVLNCFGCLLQKGFARRAVVIPGIVYSAVVANFLIKFCNLSVLVSLIVVRKVRLFWSWSLLSLARWSLWVATLSPFLGVLVVMVFWSLSWSVLKFLTFRLRLLTLATTMRVILSWFEFRTRISRTVWAHLLWTLTAIQAAPSSLTTGRFAMIALIWTTIVVERLIPTCWMLASGWLLFRGTALLMTLFTWGRSVFRSWWLLLLLLVWTQ